MATTIAASIEKNLMNRNEVAQRLGLSVRTVSQFIADGRIRCVRLGGRVKVHRDEVERLEREGTGI